MGKYGTNLTGFGAFEGGVNNDKGANIISTDSEGEESQLFSLLSTRAIQAGVVNGDFAVPPDAAGDTITEENALPYWTYTDVNSDGAITAAIVADAGAASGNVLRFTVAGGTLTGKSATLTRFVPVASSASRSFSFYAEATFESGTNSTQAEVQLSGEFYTSDQVTTTGSPIDSDTYAFNAFSLGPTGITAPDLYAVAPDLSTMTAPADAAYLKLTITISTVATQSDDRTVDLTEVRLAHGLPELLITDRDDPTSPPAFISAVIGELGIQSGSGDYLLLRPDALLIASSTVGITAGSGAATLQGGTTVELIAPDGVDVTTNGSTEGTLRTANVQSTGDLRLLAGGADVYLNDTSGSNPRLLFRDSAGTFYAGIKSGAANVIQILNGSSATDYAQLWAERIYPMNGSTASRYISDNGTRTEFSGGLETNGSIVTIGSIANSSISTTTATANNAVWVFSSGTTYSLRRFTSSQRYKTNIEDTDATVLEAAKKIKPRHFTSTLEDENGETRLGFIAEEVEAAGLTHAVGYDAEGRVETIDTTALIAALYARVNDLEERLAALESR